MSKKPISVHWLIQGTIIIIIIIDSLVIGFGDESCSRQMVLAATNQMIRGNLKVLKRLD